MPSTSTTTQNTRTRKSALLNTLIVASGYFLSRILGLVRDIIILGQFGTSHEIDAFRASFGILDLIYLVVAGGALGSAFIPVFNEFLSKEDHEGAWSFANSLLNVVLIALVAACALIFALAEPLVAMTVGNGFDAEKQALTVTLLRLMLIQPALLGVGGLAKATLESFDRFALPALGSNLYNIGIIVGALLAPWFGIMGLIWGVNLGAALFVAIQLPGLLKIGWRYAPKFEINTPSLRQVAKLIGPRLFGQSAWQIGLIALASFATQLGEGAVTANSAALQLMMLPHGLIALSLGTVIFPQLARFYAAGDTASLRETTLHAVRQIMFLALPCMAALAILSFPIIRLLFERGRFDVDSTLLTSQALTFYALGLVAFAVAEIEVRCFYAMQDTRTPVYVGIGAVAINVVLGYLMVSNGIGLRGLALGFSIANTAEALALLWLLRPRLGFLGGDFWRSSAKMLLATAVCALFWWLSYRISLGWLPILGQQASYQWRSDVWLLGLWLVIIAALGLGIYFAVAAALRLPEMQTTLARFKQVVARVRKRA